MLRLTLHASFQVAKKCICLILVLPEDERFCQLAQQRNREDIFDIDFQEHSTFLTLKSHYARTLDASAIFNYGTLVRYALSDFSSASKSHPGHFIGPLVAAELSTRCALDVLYLHQAGPYFRQVIRVER